MPLNLGYLFSCYGIWLAAVVIYIITVRYKLKTYDTALENLQSRKKS